MKDQFKECPEYLRHKTTLINPENLLRVGIKLRKVVQRPREFVISRAAGYHSGFNAGYNIAEAVNFALPVWVEVGSKANACMCARDSVKINMDQFMDTLKSVSDYKQHS